MGYADNLGKTSAEPHIDEASKTVDVTLTFKGADKTGTDAESTPVFAAPTRGSRPPGR